ncbi:MAG: tetratricopeptide repeat protein [Acidobacteriaceae bacterium]|nr:tetratricopeptide repeat protein [Acidobacteriaceae bacterium]MBV9295234.1 tetratricopeptide repeat protein [Acidobacteriaceae bacterium]MBV9767456.1 tetratricopeptide repeat protein [Acidobacteriaceae bacterium]
MTEPKSNAAVPTPLRVFISYSHKDDELHEKLVIALSQLQRDGLVERWDDREMTAGTEWAGNIDQRLNEAEIVLLLVSPDFVASGYCYDVEMSRALERHKNGEARVIPIILRPSDWKTAPFARLKALPKDGKPATEWPSLDRAFVNVADGLRSVAEELLTPAGPSEQSVRTLVRASAARRPKQFALIAVAAAIVLLAVGLWFVSRNHQRAEQIGNYTSQGDDLLNVGRYAQAREPYRQALRLDPANARAKLGIEITELAASKSDAVSFEQPLTQMLAQSPNNSYLRVLNGDNLAAQRRWNDARHEYEQAKKLNPKLAEAYFRLGVIDDKQGDIRDSIKMYEKAVDLSHHSPQYVDNLAYEYFKHGDYDQAVAEYGQILYHFPLAALESATIRRLQGDLEQAREEELTAIGWLTDSSVRSLPENQLPWYFPGLSQYVTINTPNDKLCYAQFELSATLYLKGDANGANDHAQQALQACGSRSTDLKTAVRWEIERVADERDELKTHAQAYCQKFLSE